MRSQQRKLNKKITTQKSQVKNRGPGTYLARERKPKLAANKKAEETDGQRWEEAAELTATGQPVQDRL